MVIGLSYQTITVDVPPQSYPIYIGQQLLGRRDLLAAHIAGHQVMIVTQPAIADFYLRPLLDTLASYECDVMHLQDGEQYKNAWEWWKIIDALCQREHERSTTLIALGGGVTGDMTGFAAACYQRGVNYIQIPTTLIAQVDASIGGKTAINHAAGKNKVGAFYQPRCVLADVDVLRTLPQREYRAGLAEVIKYGLIADLTFFEWLENNMTALLSRKTDTLLHVIHRSASIKAAIVSQDEKEQGIRSLLNLGHTFGHVLEAASDYQGILHGEAVAIGMQMAAELSRDYGWLSSEDVTRIQRLLLQVRVNGYNNFPTVSQFMHFLKQDKKCHAEKVRFILLQAIGQARMVGDVTAAQLSGVLGRYCMFD